MLVFPQPARARVLGRGFTLHRPGRDLPSGALPGHLASGDLRRVPRLRLVRGVGSEVGAIAGFDDLGMHG